MFKTLIALFIFVTLLAVANAGLECGVCQSLITGLEKKTISEDQDFIKEAYAECDSVTFGVDMLDAICKNIVDQEILKVKDDIKNKEDPLKVCQKITMC